MSLPTRVQRGLFTVDPFDMFGRDLGTVMDQFLNARNGSVNGSGNGYDGAIAPYGVDVREDADHLYVEAELPGFKKEEVDITLENSTLTITAERKEKPAEKTQGDWLLRERRYNHFVRSFTLPPTVDEGSVNASLTDGVLKVTLNKREEIKPRKIAVS